MSRYICLCLYLLPLILVKYMYKSMLEVRFSSCCIYVCSTNTAPVVQWLGFLPSSHMTLKKAISHCLVIRHSKRSVFDSRLVQNISSFFLFFLFFLQFCRGWAAMGTSPGRYRVRFTAGVSSYPRDKLFRLRNAYPTPTSNFPFSISLLLLLLFSSSYIFQVSNSTLIGSFCNNIFASITFCKLRKRPRAI